MKQVKVLMLVLTVLLMAAACTATRPEAEDQGKTAATTPAVEKTAENTGTAEQKPVESAVDLSKIKANENGQVMILMYHGIGSKEEEWVRTSDNFRKDLEVLYDKGYRLIPLKDFIENDIKVEAGYTPVVLTFDDGLENQFKYIEENGVKKIDPDCAIGILEDFYKKHPDFGRAASFYVYYPIPFRQKELIKEKFDFLVSNGYEIGNHAYTHENLGKLDAAGVQKALGLNVKNTQTYLPGYDVFSLALPYGAAPKGDDFKYAASGEFEGTKYNHRAILKVGSNPALAPNDIKFDPLKLPRVRASEMKTDGVGMYDWLKYFDKHPEKKYISDGNPKTIAVPETEVNNVDKDKLKDKELVTYTAEK